MKIREEFLPFSPPYLGDDEKKELIDTIDSGWITTGPKTELFQDKFCEYVGAKYAVAVNSGTAALHLSIVAHGIKEGDEVILPTFTFASTGHVVLYQHAKPVLVDIDPVTYNLAPELIEAAVTPHTKAIIPVHFGGLSCNLDEIYKIADKHGIIVIEDAAHAIGAEYKGCKIGGFGRTTCFSFYATKNITTGEGGMIVTDDYDLAEQMRVMSMYGISDARKIWKRYAPQGSWFYDICFLGYKYNMMDIQASLGIHQLAKLDSFINKRTRFARMYRDAFAEYQEITVPYFPTFEESKHAWHIFPILINSESLSIDRDSFIEEMKKRNIGTSVFFRPLHLHSFYEKTLGHTMGDFPVSESVFERTISLPLSPKFSDDDISYVIDNVIDIIRKNLK